MPLIPGSRVGPYDVIAPIGAGGMGEVFRARDARLQRDVALKVLPAATVADADSRARFEREARVLASLNHSGIAQVFGVEIDNGAPVIVMELVEGPTLAERLTKGPLAIGEALTIASAICDGLEAAHERGIIHRDLKPANIKVSHDGAVKILDFGLARVVAPADHDADAPTRLGDTSSGVILGTASYMSPEQARGRELDRRTDIWSFGCILYEMLTGARAFPGESMADIVAGIMEREPDWTRLPAGTPPRIAELLGRCLQKKAKDRLRDIADARYEIEQARRAPKDGSGARGSHAAPARPWWHPAMWFAAGAAVAGLLIALPLFRSREAAPSVSYRTSVTLPANTTLALSRGSAVAISPDGHTLVYAARNAGKTLLYRRDLNAFDSHAIPGTEDAQNPFFSPDGHWVGFFTNDKMKRVSLEGGAPLTIAAVTNPRGEAWGPGDQIFFTPSNNVGIVRVPVAGGKVEPVTALITGERSHRWPRFLPGGSMLFSIWNDLGWEPARIALRQPDGAYKVVVEGGGYPRYVADANGGYLVYARVEGIMAVPFDEKSGTVSGQPAPIVDGVITNFSGGAHFDVASNGTVVYVPGTSLEGERRLVWVTMDGVASPALVAREGMGLAWRLSADGRRVVRNNTYGATRSNWIEDLAGRTSNKLPTPLEGFVASPVWSHDGNWIALSIENPTMNIYRQSTGAQTVVERLTESPHQQAPRDVSRDGRYLFYTEFDPITGADIWVLTLPSGAPGAPGAAAVTPSALSPRALLKTDAIENYPVLSPDGRWLAYQSNDTGRFEVYVKSFPETDRTLRVSVDGGVSPMWSADGKEIFFRDVASQMRAASLNDAVLGAPQRIRVLFDARQYENVFSVSPDGKRLLMMPVVDAERAPDTINVVFNFLSELRRRVR